jgi:hypothetical protein
MLTFKNLALLYLESGGIVNGNKRMGKKGP